jgi:hypothetical protein
MDIELVETGIRWWLERKPKWTFLHSFYEKL